MTGFAQIEGQNDYCSWIWEIRSVNGKGLNVRIRVPYGFDDLEVKANERIKKKLRRGNVSLTLNINWFNKDEAYSINEKVLENYVCLLSQLSSKVSSATPVTLDGLLSLKGVVETKDFSIPPVIQKKLERDLLRDFDKVLLDMKNMRASEGHLITDALIQQVETIKKLCNKASELSECRLIEFRKRIKKQVKSLMEDVSGLSDSRLEQEVVLLMTKVDVNEELDRLKCHVSSALDLLKQNNAVGRKLDFLCQELNREVNTLCSKSGNVKLTRVGLDMKLKIEQFREQVQNIE